MSNDKFKVCDLFSGTGAFSIAFEETGRTETVFANDNDANGKKIHLVNSMELIQDDIMNIKEFPTMDILTGGFPCFPAGMNILTDSGYKEIQLVELNDKLLTHKGNWRKILNTQYKKYNGIMYGFNIHDHNTVICTSEHPFLVRLRTEVSNTIYVVGEPTWLPASAITSDHYFGMIKKDGELKEVLFINDCDYFTDGVYDWYKLSSYEISITNSLDVYNFEVEHDNSYIVEGVIAHNCQPFSIAGKRNGFEDVRSGCFWKIVEITNTYKPKCIFLENVKNLSTHDSGRTFEIIKNAFSEYEVFWNILDVSEYTGIPPHRERIYIVCMRKDLKKKIDLTFDKVSLRPLSNFLETNIDIKHYYNKDNETNKTIRQSVIKRHVVYQYRRTFVRENMSGVCLILTANMGTGGHNVPLILDDVGVRKLTPRECFNLQGFSQDYKFGSLSDTALYKLAGNAVCLKMVKKIVDRIILSLDDSN